MTVGQKMSSARALEIYHAKGKLREISEKFHTTTAHASLIKNGKLWKCLTDPVWISQRIVEIEKELKTLRKMQANDH
jgi:hypothetical protein